MIKLFLHYLKTKWLPMVVFLVITLAITFFSVTASNPPVSYSDPIFDLFVAYALIMAFVLPALLFNFQMKKISIDRAYSTPVKKWVLYFVPLMLGLGLIICYFSINYGVMTLLCVIYKASYSFNYFGGFYLEMLFATIVMYITNCFAFTRANTLIDGIIFMIFYSTIAILLIECVGKIIYASNYYFGYEELFSCTLYRTIQVSTVYRQLSHGRSASALETRHYWLSYISLGVQLVVFTTLFFVLNTRYKAENSEVKSDSWFGYKTLIPVATYCGICLSFAKITPTTIIFDLIIIVIGFVFYIIYSRGFHFGYKKMLAFVGSILLAYLTMIISSSLHPIAANYWYF